MVIFPFPMSWFSRRCENKNPTMSGEGFVFLPQVGNGNIAMSDKWGILPISTSPDED